METIYALLRRIILYASVRIPKRADGYESNFYKTYRIPDKCHLREKKK